MLLQGLFWAAVPAMLNAADSAFLQLAVASPDPVQSGGEVTYQVILANNGNQTWEAGRYYFEVQIYNADKTYLIKTARILGEKDVVPGGTALAYVPFQVPENYSGPHFYRIFMTHKEQRIYEGPYTYFSVTPLPPQPPEEKPVTFSGNAMVSMRNFSPDKNKDTLNLNVNTVGQVYGRSMLFNLNTQTTRPSHTKIIQVLLTYYGPISTLNIGDVQPNFSPLSYANSGARGLWLQMPLKRFSTELIGAQTVFKIAGSSNPARSGTFARYVIGAQEKVDLPWNLTAAVDYVKVFDDKNSLSADPTDAEFRGPSPKEVKNEVVSAGLGWKGFEDKFSVEAQAAQSDFQENTLSNTPATVSARAQALRMATGYKGNKLGVRAGVQRTDPDFRALAAPSATSDRQTMDLALSYTQPMKKSMLSLSVTGNQFTDNIKNDPKKITTTQTSFLMANALSNPRPWPGLSLFVSVNQGQDKAKTALDNQTQTFGFSVNQPIGGRTSMSLGVQQSQFKDNLKKSADLTTQTQSFSMVSALGSRINLSVGGTLAKTDSQATASAPSGSLTSNSYSASVNYVAIRDKLVLQSWYTVSNRNGTSSGTRQDVKDQSQNLELTYQVLKNLAVTAGGTKNKSDDSVTPTRNLDETILTSRLTYTF